MDPLTYLTTFSPDFGTLEWVFFVAQLALAGAGVYLAFLRVQPHPLRKTAQTQLGTALLAVGAVGTLVGILRLTNVQLFTMPIWMTIITAIELVLIVVALYYAAMVYPARLSAYAEANRSRGARRSITRSQPALRTNGANGSGGAFEAPRAVGSTSRREARRDRKRKSR